MGCGGDDEESPDPTDQEYPELTTEELVGSWEVVSIDDETPEQTTAANYPDAESTITQNSFVFTANGSWTRSFGWLLLIPLDAETVQQFTFTQELNGTYTVSGSTVSFVLDSVDVTYDPRDLGEWLHDQTEEEIAVAIRLDFGAIQNYTGIIRENTLTLQGSPELVLRKQ